MNDVLLSVVTLVTAASLCLVTHVLGDDPAMRPNPQRDRQLTPENLSRMEGRQEIVVSMNGLSLRVPPEAMNVAVQVVQERVNARQLYLHPAQVAFSGHRFNHVMDFEDNRSMMEARLQGLPTSRDVSRPEAWIVQSVLVVPNRQTREVRVEPLLPQEEGGPPAFRFGFGVWGEKEQESYSYGIRPVRNRDRELVNPVQNLIEDGEDWAGRFAEVLNSDDVDGPALQLRDTLFLASGPERAPFKTRLLRGGHSVVYATAYQRSAGGNALGDASVVFLIFDAESEFVARGVLSAFWPPSTDELERRLLEFLGGDVDDQE